MDSPRPWTETPSRRTGFFPASVFSSRATARAAISSGGPGRRGAGVAPGDRAKVGVAQLEHDRAREERLALEDRDRVPGERVHLGADRLEVLEVLRVGLLAADRLALLVGIDGALVDRRTRACAASPPSCRRPFAAARRAPCGRRPGVAIPEARSLPAVTGPTPHNASTGSFRRNRSTRSGAMTVRPSGFFQPEAIFARNLFGATPAEAVSCVSSRIRAFRRRATATPRGSPQAFSVTSR